MLPGRWDSKRGHGLRAAAQWSSLIPRAVCLPTHLEVFIGDRHFSSVYGSGKEPSSVDACAGNDIDLARKLQEKL